METGMEKIDGLYEDFENGMEWIGEALMSGSKAIVAEVDHSAESLVSLMEGSERRIMVQELQEVAEGMTAEEREFYFDDLEANILRLCD